VSRAEGVADDAIFSNGGHNAGSIANEFSRGKVFFRPAQKADRISGWLSTVTDLEVRRASLEDTYMALVREFEAGQRESAVRAFEEVTR